jgi:hypothetical protein
MTGQNCASIYTPSNKGMKLTKLSAAPTLAPQAALGRRRRLMPAPVSGMARAPLRSLSPVFDGRGGPEWADERRHP